MANTKTTKRKNGGGGEKGSGNDTDTDSESEFPQNQGNGDLVDDLSHVHDKCDDLMAKLKALNQAAVDMPMASAAVSTSPFVSPVITPVQTMTTGDVVEGVGAPVQENMDKSLSEVAATVDAVSDSLINYLTNGDTNSTGLVVATNTKVDVDEQLVGEVDNSNDQQLIEVNVVQINEAGIHQPLKPIGEIVKELDQLKNKKSQKHKNTHIKESNIIVNTPVFDQFSRMVFTKKTPPVIRGGIKKQDVLQPSGRGRGNGGCHGQ